MVNLKNFIWSQAQLIVVIFYDDEYGDDFDDDVALLIALMMEIVTISETSVSILAAVRT